jgi:hypothetical protein
VTQYGLIGPTTDGNIVWFATPADLVAQWDNHPGSSLRIMSDDGQVTFGTQEEVAPVYALLQAQRGETPA